MTSPHTPRPYARWGDDIDDASIAQMDAAMRLPVAAAGALMPDAHVGYGLPIGGVLAVRGAVIPYAVGVDIACRMKLTVLDMPPTTLDSDHGISRLTRAIETETRFGVGAAHEKPHDHDALDRDWSVSPVTRRLKDKARSQLGTSGSGNHFVEFGTLTIDDHPRPTGNTQEPSTTNPRELGLPPGTYLALLSHSGSRGTGAAVCDHYSRLAMSLHPDLPKEQRHLAWLDLASQEGQEYWEAMNLMGHYASANHAVIHRAILKHLGAQPIAGVENHHNFAWRETHALTTTDSPAAHTPAEELIVHRKGATPAALGELGMIPGTMASPGFVVRGLGSPASLRSASHGAGRAMSRTQAKKSLAWGNVRRELQAQRITVLSAGVDEAPAVYKDIHRVMAAQSDLVEIIARFDPKLVKMAPAGERAED